MTGRWSDARSTRSMRADRAVLCRDGALTQLAAALPPYTYSEAQVYDWDAELRSVERRVSVYVVRRSRPAQGH
jgi:hypothetical protein